VAKRAETLSQKTWLRIVEGSEKNKAKSIGARKVFARIKSLEGFFIFEYIGKSRPVIEEN
jgi:hypothetical protein